MKDSSLLLGAELPLFIPSLDFFLRLASSDIFVIADSLKFSSRSSVQRRQLIIQEQEKWITVPVHFTEGDQIREVKIDYHENWQAKIIRTLRFAYHDFPFFEEFYPGVEKWLANEYQSLAQLNFYFIDYLTKIWDINTEIVHFSSVYADHQMDLIVNLCKKMEAVLYIVDQNNDKFVDREALDQEGIRTLDMGNYRSYLPEELADKIRASSLELLFEHGPQMQLVFENVKNVTQSYTKKN